ncbi:MAG: aspartate/glutamate racemase family protein [Anaerolineae bacterium]
MKNLVPPSDAIHLFEDYLRITGVAHIDPEPDGDPALIGKRLGLLNGSSWITLWANYFGRAYLPGVHLVNVGNEAVQINFMEAHEAGQPTPPQSNIDAFVRYACDLVELADVDAVLITCSTMNRSYPQVQAALAPAGVPVVQIDRPMMEAAVNHGGRALVVATHGPTVDSTQALLRETAEALEREITFAGVTVENAWHRLAAGDVKGHNEALAAAIRRALEREEIDCVVLAQLSMTVFLLSYPDPLAAFGVPVFTSGRCGFERMREVLVGGP